MRSRLSPLDLIRTLKQIEVDVGRKPTIPMGPRLIDIDILFYDDLVLDQAPVLTIPHPRIAERPFVLYPLCE